MASDGRHSDRGNSVLKLSSLNNSRIGRCPSRISNTASNKRLERTRHERASSLSCPGEPLKRSVRRTRRVVSNATQEIGLRRRPKDRHDVTEQYIALLPLLMASLPLRIAVHLGPVHAAKSARADRRQYAARRPEASRISFSTAATPRPSTPGWPLQGP